MSKSESISIPVVSAETFVESDFEERYILYASKFGLAGKELERGTPLTVEDFLKPDANRLVECTHVEQIREEVPILIGRERAGEEGKEEVQTEIRYRYVRRVKKNGFIQRRLPGRV